MTTYEQAGVDIAAGDALVDRIKPLAAATDRPGVLGGIGGFGALFDLKAAGFSDPVLVSATDGVGTKLLIAIETGLHATVVAGIAEGCRQSGCALVGGETAEMPGMYAAGHYDLAGFAVGAAERAHLLPANVAEGDIVLGLPSSGVHSNGFSLVRHVLRQSGVAWHAPAPFATTKTLAEVLMQPTRLYVKQVLALHRAGLLHAAAHITGGGLPGNLPRVLPAGLNAVIDTQWAIPPVFHWLARTGAIASSEMLSVFNCGIGMVLVVPDEVAATQALRGLGETPVKMGHVARSGRNEPQVQFKILLDF